MSDRETRELVEAVITPYRERDVDGRIVPPAVWWDLPPEAFDELYVEQALAREIERAVDPQGESGTVKAVLARIWGSGGPEEKR